MTDSRPVIMVIEDEEAVQASYDVILGEDYDLLLTKSAEEALEMLDLRTDIRAIFLDYILPGMDGLQFMEKLRERNSIIPVIVITGKGSEEVAARFSSCGIFRYIMEPFHPDQIIELTRQALEEYDLKKKEMDVASEDASEMLPVRVREAVDFILNSYQENIGVAEIAAFVDCRQEHLSRIFHRHLGQTPHEFLEEVRMNRAKELIETTQQPVNIISQKCGYRSESYFIQVFKKKFGHTPAEHRRYYSQL